MNRGERTVNRYFHRGLEFEDDRRTVTVITAIWNAYGGGHTAI